MITREILSDLMAWKQRKNRKPLILRGARQVGKTTVVNEFAKNFDDYLHLNLEKKNHAQIFENSDDPDLILDSIYLQLAKQKKQGEVLLFIDEIQNSPKAMAILRYFYEELPNLYIIAAGSLLETIIDLNVSFPVGRVEYLAMRPCSFLEFLNGIDADFDAEVIKNLNGNPIHDRLIQHFKKYMIVGGMPAIISGYAENNDLIAIEPLYESLLTSYQDDSQKYARNESQRKILSHILSAGWSEAAEIISFEGFAGSRYKSREVSEAFRVLERTMLLELTYPIIEPRIPLLENMKRRPKLLWFDTGLVNYKAGIRSELYTTEDVMGIWRGRIAEQVTAQELLAYKHNISVERHFWSKDKSGSMAEVDFVVQHQNMVIPIEVKSGNNSKLKSLHIFMDEVSHDIAVRVWNQPFSVDIITTPKGKTFKLINLPFYYLSQLSKILDNTISDFSHNNNSQTP